VGADGVGMGRRNKPTITEIVRRCQASYRDDIAWNELMVYLTPGIIKKCNSYGLAYDEIQDILGGSQAELVTSIQNIKKPASVRYFMRRIVERQIYLKFRTKIKTVRMTIPIMESLLDIKASEDPFNDTMVSELGDMLYRIIKVLPQRDQDLIYKCFFETPRKPYKQIEKELGIPPTQLGAYRAKVLKKLKRLWKDKFGE